MTLKDLGITVAQLELKKNPKLEKERQQHLDQQAEGGYWCED
jgi:hypothetical protein